MLHSNLLQSKTIAEFAASCTTTTTVAVKQEGTFDTPFELSPIQRWFFEQLPFKSGDEREQFYNQGFYVKIRQNFPVDQIESAVSKLVDHHSMLRSRFHKVDGDWKQLVLKPGKGLHHFGSSTCRSMKQIQTFTQGRHNLKISSLMSHLVSPVAMVFRFWRMSLLLKEAPITCLSLSSILKIRRFRN